MNSFEFSKIWNQNSPFFFFPHFFAQKSSAKFVLLVEGGGFLVLVWRFDALWRISVHFFHVFFLEKMWKKQIFGKYGFKVYKIYIDGIWRCFGQGKIVLPPNSAFRDCKVQGLQACKAQHCKPCIWAILKSARGYYFTLVLGGE